MDQLKSLLRSLWKCKSLLRFVHVVMVLSMATMISWPKLQTVDIEQEEEWSKRDTEESINFHQTNSDSLQKCMLNFLVNSKLYKYNTRSIFLDDLEDETDEEEAILRAYKLKNNPNVVLPWKWGAEKPKPEETIYEEGEDGFEELKKCEQFGLIIKKNNGPSSSSKHMMTDVEAHHSHHHFAEIKRKGKMVAHEKKKIDVMKLLKYFNEEQLFFEEFENIIKFDENKNYKNMDEKHCPICLVDFKQNDKLERLYCGHYYHFECIEKSRKNNNYKCPLCRANLDGSKGINNGSPFGYGLLSLGHSVGLIPSSNMMSPLAQTLLRSRRPISPFSRT